MIMNVCISKITSAQRQTACPAYSAGYAPLGCGPGKGGTLRQGFGRLNPSAQCKLGGQHHQAPNPPACPACPACTVPQAHVTILVRAFSRPDVLRGCGVGAASPKVWAKARTACPDALAGSGACNVGQFFYLQFNYGKYSIFRKHIFSAGVSGSNTNSVTTYN